MKDPPPRPASLVAASASAAAPPASTSSLRLHDLCPCEHSSCGPRLTQPLFLQIAMALNIPGVVAVVVFYILILATGIWAARKARKAERKSHGGQAEVVLLGDRSISLLVGVFTMTGTSPSGPRVAPKWSISRLRTCFHSCDYSLMSTLCTDGVAARLTRRKDIFYIM